MTILTHLIAFAYAPVSTVDGMGWSPGYGFVEVRYGCLWVRRHTDTEALILLVHDGHDTGYLALMTRWVPLLDLIVALSLRNCPCTARATDTGERVELDVPHEPNLLHPDAPGAPARHTDHGIPERLSNAAALLTYREAIETVVGEPVAGAWESLHYPDPETFSPYTNDILVPDAADLWVCHRDASTPGRTRTRTRPTLPRTL